MPGPSVLAGFLLAVALFTPRLTDQAMGSVVYGLSTGQERATQSRNGYRDLFAVIEKSLNNGNISALTPYLAPQVQVNIRGGESGYYSASQAYYLLENYFRSRKVLGFGFSTIGESDSNPYATGGANLNFKGTRELAQVYVSLSRSGQQWRITQINIY